MAYKKIRDRHHHKSISSYLTSHAATAFSKFPGVIACVAPGALLTRPLLTANPLDLVYEGLWL